MTGSLIKDLVIVKLEERSIYLNPDSAMGTILIGSGSLSDLKPVYSYIESQLSIAANEVLLSAPIHKTSFVIETAPTVVPSVDGTGYIELNSDFLRLHTLKMSDWDRPVHVAIMPSHPEYSLQFNKYTRGTANKPVVVYTGVTPATETPKLYYYSITSPTPVVDMLYYVPKFSETDDYGDDIAEAIALNTAKKVMEVFGNADGVAIMQNELTAVLANMQL